MHWHALDPKLYSVIAGTLRASNSADVLTTFCTAYYPHLIALSLFWSKTKFASHNIPKYICELRICSKSIFLFWFIIHQRKPSVEGQFPAKLFGFRNIVNCHVAVFVAHPVWRQPCSHNPTTRRNTRLSAPKHLSQVDIVKATQCSQSNGVTSFLGMISPLNLWSGMD